jgi:hypothetical protein
VIFRSHQRTGALFGDFDLLTPGLTWTPSWHPEETSDSNTAGSFHDSG